MLQNEDMKKDFLDRFDTAAPAWCGIDSEEEPESLMKKLFYHYLDTIEISEDYLVELEKVWSASI